MLKKIKFCCNFAPVPFGARPGAADDPVKDVRSKRASALGTATTHKTHTILPHIILSVSVQTHTLLLTGLLG